jgi:hypothetical protein
VSVPKRVLAALVVIVAAHMVGAAVYSVSAGLSREALSALSGAEILAMAALVLPWFTVYAARAARRFSPGEAAAGAWRVLAAASVLLLLGQIAAYVPSVFDLGRAEPVIVIFGQVMPAAFRVALCWALWRMRRAYRETGLHFHLKATDTIVALVVAAVAVVLISRREILFAYWTANAEMGETSGYVMTAAQVFNFLLYPAVFYTSLAMSRFAVQMGGGLVARAWGGVALYGLLQPLHAFAIALLWPVYGPIAAVAFDNFIVLCAFAALAFGPIYQVEATEVSRQ